MKNCELCNGLARIYCLSDQANLCWDCDAKVHSVNFLVARHSRSLLCHVCQSPTAWSAAGAKVGRTVSVCDGCVNDERNGGEGEDEEEIDLEDIQVVPWSSTPPPASSSSSDESLHSHKYSSLKRMSENDDDSGTSTSHREDGILPQPEERDGDEAASSSSTRMRKPLKIQRTEGTLTGRVESTGYSGMMELIGVRRDPGVDLE